VDRTRRRQNDGTNMMQKAMELKKRKNLEPIKGNPFSTLSIENFENLTDVLKLHVSLDKAEPKEVIESLIDRERKGYEIFVDNHPKVTLPIRVLIFRKGS
jgi:hypothetical protein